MTVEYAISRGEGTLIEHDVVSVFGLISIIIKGYFSDLVGSFFGVDTTPDETIIFRFV